MKIDVEKLTEELFAEMLPLAQKCWEESTAEKAESCAFYGSREFQIEPDFDAYMKIQETGFLTIVTLRDEGKLVGYIEGFVYRSLRHKSLKGGMGDSIYVEPEYRVYTPPMIERFEKEMRQGGADIIGWPTSPNGPVHKLLLASGFVGDDVIMEKKLCA